MNCRRVILAFAFVFCVLAPRFALAHDVWVDDDGSKEAWMSWEFDPGTMFGLTTPAMYATCRLDDNGTGDTGAACTGTGSTPCRWGTASCVRGVSRTRR